MSHEPQLGEDSRQLAPGFLQTPPHVPFPFAHFVFYPFTVINVSHEYKYVQSPVNPPSKSWNLGVVLETLTYIFIYVFF